MTTSTITVDVSHLHASAIDVTPRHVDFAEGSGDTWTSTEATECSGCGKKMLADDGEYEHREIDRRSACGGYVSGSDPMMNYIYGLPEMPSDEQIIEALADLPLCVVTFPDAIHGEDTFLALTGGGMNMSWSIIAAYVRLGYLPPAYFTPPSFAGMRLTDERRLLIEACRATQRWISADATRTLERLDDLERSMARAA